TVNLPIISNASLIVGISNYLLRWYCFLLLLYAISRQKSTICCDRAFRKNYLTPALEQNHIQFTISDKPNSKHQKYKRKG
ncbi:MAG: hypothetical protein PUG86_06340, partial [Veillonella caviae]|nr:hypothetical protein [Veillonella caviae]